jgi:hypothetical protein
MFGDQVGRERQQQQNTIWVAGSSPLQRLITRSDLL